LIHFKEDEMHTTYSICARLSANEQWITVECPLTSLANARGVIKNLYQVRDLEACRAAISDTSVVTEVLNEGRLNEMTTTVKIVAQFSVPVLSWNGTRVARDVIIVEHTETYTK
jgi:hypothetical protein